MDCLLPVEVYAAGEKLALLVREQKSRIAADKMLRSTKLCLQGSHSAGAICWSLVMASKLSHRLRTEFQRVINVSVKSTFKVETVNSMHLIFLEKNRP